MNYVEPIRDSATVKGIAESLKQVDDKYYVMYMIGIYSGLRVCDILRLRVGDVKGKTEIRLREKKTGKEKTFPINEELGGVIAEYCRGKAPDAFLIPSARAKGKAVSREYAWRVIHRTGLRFGLEHLGTHTMRKTFGYHFYMQTKDIALLMKIFNHSDQSITLRYIGVEKTTINEAMRKFSYRELSSLK